VHVRSDTGGGENGTADPFGDELVSLLVMSAQGLLLGSDAYTRVHAALADRLAAFEGQKGVAYSTDVDEFHPAAT
jgi:hypothetical protein